MEDTDSSRETVGDASGGGGDSDSDGEPSSGEDGGERQSGQAGEEEDHQATSAEETDGSDSDEGEDDDDGTDDDDGGEGVNFDRSQALAHTYLGDREDLADGACLLTDEHKVHVPLLPIQDLVLFPGEVLPLRLTSPLQQEIIHSAMNALPPLKDLIAVIHIQRPLSSSPKYECPTTISVALPAGIHSTGCTALIRQIRESENGTLNCIAVGHQRMKVDKLMFRLSEAPNMMQVPITILQDIRVPRLPKGLDEGATFWGRWVYRPFDPDCLAAEAKALVRIALPKVDGFKGNPLQLSFWLAANMPLDLDMKQSLLCAGNEVERLRMEIEAIHLLQLSKLKCSSCRQKVGSSQDIICMQESGPASAYVNEHGFVHNMVTVSRVHRAGIELQGEPDAAFSWFPGYSWTICVCSTCGSHLGWRFTATKDSLRPRAFWGIRVSALHTAN